MVVCLQSGCFYGQTRARSVTPHVRVVLQKYTRAETTPMHSHALPYLALVARGSFRECGATFEHVCVPGSLAINTAGEEHLDAFEAEFTEVINIELGPSWLEALRDEQKSDPGYAWTTRAGLTERARFLRGHIEHPEPLSPFIVEGVAAELLGVTMAARARELGSARAPAWIGVIEDAVQAHFRRPPPLAELARLVDRSPSQIVRAFRRWRGMSLGSYVRRLRAEHARHALLETSATLSEISIEAGYSDQSHMTRELGAYLGCTPGRLRRTRKRDQPRD